MAFKKTSWFVASEKKFRPATHAYHDFLFLPQSVATFGEL